MSMENLAGRLVGYPAERLQLLFQPKLSSLEFSQTYIVRRWTTSLVLNGAVEIFVPGAKFTNTGFDRHGLRLLAVGD